MKVENTIKNGKLSETVSVEWDGGFHGELIEAALRIIRKEDPFKTDDEIVLKSGDSVVVDHETFQYLGSHKFRRYPSDGTKS